MSLPPFESGLLSGRFPFVRIGDGRPMLVVFPGINDAMQDAEKAVRKWRWFYRDLAEHRTVMLISRRRDLPLGATTRDMAADYAGLFDELLEPADIISFSMGGLIAQHFAADHPQHVKRLILGVTGYRNGDDARRWMVEWTDLARQGAWPKLMSEMAERSYVGRRGEIFAALPGRFPQAVIPAPDDPHLFLVSAAACVEHDTRERLPLITAPTLVIGGDRDRFFPESLLRETAALIPGAQLHLIPGAGHAALEEFKSAFEPPVLTFLNSTS